MSPAKAFLIIGLSFITGIGLANWWVPSVSFLAGGSVVALGLLVFWWSEPRVRMLLLAILIVMVGMARFGLSTALPVNHISLHNGKEVQLKGFISDAPDVRSDKTKLTIKINQVDSQSVVGKVLVTVPRYPEYSYGQEVEMSGKLQTPKVFEDFDYPAYLARFNIYSLLYEPEMKLTGFSQGSWLLRNLLTFRRAFQTALQRALPEPQASLAAGMLLGTKREIPTTWRDRFNTVGLGHIIVISGYHMSLVVGVIGSMLRGRLSRRTVLVVSSLAIIFFVVLTGIGASAVRAGIMAALLMIAFNLGRVSSIRNALVLAALVMLLVNPRLLITDISFQLSFLATISIVLCAPVLQRWLRFIPESGGLRSALVMSLAAQVLVLPLISYYFGRLSLVAPLANVLVLPLLPAAMAASFLSGLATMLSTTIGQLLALPANLLLSYFTVIVKEMSSWSGSSWETGRLAPLWLVVYYGFCLGLWVSWKHLKKLTKYVKTT